MKIKILGTIKLVVLTNKLKHNQKKMKTKIINKVSKTKIKIKNKMDN